MMFYLLLVAFVVVAALFLGLKFSRLQEEQVWEELVGQGVPPDGFEYEDRHDREGQKMSTSTPIQSSDFPREVDLRRSSRVDRFVPLLILGANQRGESFQERTSTISVNLHGCRYLSRHEYPPGGLVTVQIAGAEGVQWPIVHARVRSIHPPQSSRELCQVGIELEIPGNVWGIPVPPEDWQGLLSNCNSDPLPSTAADTSSDSSTCLSKFHEEPSAPLERSDAVAVDVVPNLPAAGGDEAEAGPPTKPTQTDGGSRVVITADQLLKALQGRIQRVADRAVQISLSGQFDQALKNAIAKIEDDWRAHVRQTEEFSAARLAKVQNLWEKGLLVYHTRAQEISSRLEALASKSQQTLAETQRFVECFANEMAPQLDACLNGSLGRANSEFEARVAQVSRHQLGQLTESAQLAVRDARSQLNEGIAQLRSLLASTGGVLSREKVESLIESSSEETFRRLEERLGDVCADIEQRHDLALHRSGEMERQLENLVSETRQARTQYEATLTEVRSFLANARTSVPQERVNSLLSASREQILGHLEEFRRLLEVQINQSLTEAKEFVTFSTSSVNTECRTTVEESTVVESTPEG